MYNNNWGSFDNLGKTLENMVNSAVRMGDFSHLTREFDTCKMAPKSEHIEIKPLSANFFVKFYVFLRACL